MKKTIILITLLCMALFLVSCSSKAEDTITANQKLQVYASFNALYEFASAVGGEKAEIHTIIPAGSEPHDFEPKAADIAGLSKADVFLYQGLGMDAWSEHAIEAAKNEALTVIVASDGTNVIENTEEHDDADHDEEHEDANHEEEHDDADYDEEHDDADHDEEHDDEEHGHEHGRYDPHTWLSIKEAEISVQNIADGFSVADPDNKAFYQANAAEYIKQLEDIYNGYYDKFKALDHKHFVTGHAAFHYFCRDFGLEQNSVEDVFAEGEPSPQQLSKLVEYCKENQVTTIFAEEMASPEVSNTLAKEVDAKVQTIYTMEHVEDELTYLERMKENCERVYQSLAE